MQTQINYSRIGKALAIYTEGFVDDNGYRLKTFSITPPDISLKWSERWQKEGLLSKGQMIGSVEKHLFYDEYFTIMKICGTESQLLGYYCDVATPLQKVGDEYSLSDLILDIWIYPDATILELDRDEFEEAVHSGLISAEQQIKAEEVLRRLKTEIKQGLFPSAYLL
jgi:Protein of unknown function (DUF402)